MLCLGLDHDAYPVEGDSRSFGDLVKPVNDGVEHTGDSTLTINDPRVDGVFTDFPATGVAALNALH